MKKLVLLLMVMTLGLSSFSAVGNCAGGFSTPREAAVSFMNNMKNGNYDAAIRSMYSFRNADEKTLSSEIKLYRDYYNKKGGIKSYSIIEEKRGYDVTEIKVLVKCGNGESHDMGMKIVLRDGKWHVNAL